MRQQFPSDAEKVKELIETEMRHSEKLRSEKVAKKAKSNTHKEGKQRRDEGTWGWDAVHDAAAVGYKTKLCTLFIS